MAKLFYGLAVLAVVVALIDLQAPVGSPAAREGAILVMLAPVLAVVGFVLQRRATKVCPHCAERIRRDATKCRHCGSVVS